MSNQTRYPRDFVVAIVLSLTVIGCGAATQESPPVETSTPAATDAPAPESSGLERLEWLLGVWVDPDDGSSEERWSRLHANAFVGVNHTFEDREIVGTEHLLLTADEDEVSYRAWPQGQRSTVFRLASVDGEGAVFENPSHDWPQRLSYWRQDDRLHARVAGSEDGEERSFELSWSRRGLDEGGEGAMTTRSLSRRARVAAEPARVWAAWTTEEGATTFFAPRARIEPVVGGAYELYFDEEAPVGQQGSEGCTILELTEQRRLAFTWNFPPSIPSIRDAHTVVVVSLEPDAQGGTNVTLTQTGFREGADWDEGFAYFERVWGIVFERLQSSFTDEVQTSVEE